MQSILQLHAGLQTELYNCILQYMFSRMTGCICLTVLCYVTGLIKPHEPARAHSQIVRDIKEALGHITL